MKKKFRFGQFRQYTIYYIVDIHFKLIEISIIVKGLEIKKYFTFGAQYVNFYKLPKSIYDNFSYRNFNFQFIPKLSTN